MATRWINRSELARQIAINRAEIRHERWLKSYAGRLETAKGQAKTRWQQTVGVCLKTEKTVAELGLTLPGEWDTYKASKQADYETILPTISEVYGLPIEAFRFNPESEDSR